MKRSLSPLRVAAVLSSIVLVVGYMLYRTGGSLFPSTKSGRISMEEDPSATRIPKHDATQTPSTQSRDKREMLPGSKSMAPLIRPEQPSESAAPEPRLMPSSKSGAVFEAKDIVDGSPAPKPTTQPGIQPSQP
jgi:hypothetical protein